jgi:hypothetical protein
MGGSLYMDNGMYMCNYCKKDFKADRFEEKKINGGLTERFIQCDHCKKLYHVSFENEASLKLDKEMQANMAKAFKFKRGTTDFKKYYMLAMENKEARKEILSKLNRR